MNSIQLMGRTTSEIELKVTTSGVSVAAFSLAVDRKYTPKGEEKQTDFIPCVAWRNTAEFLSKWFRKGDMLAITGELQTRGYTDKNGNKRTAIEVVVNNAYFCGGKKNTSQQENEPPTVNTGDMPAGTNYDDDDLPF